MAGFVFFLCLNLCSECYIKILPLFLTLEWRWNQLGGHCPPYEFRKLPSAYCPLPFTLELNFLTFGKIVANTNFENFLLPPASCLLPSAFYTRTKLPDFWQNSRQRER